MLPADLAECLVVLPGSHVSSIANSILHLHGLPVYFLVGILVFGETAVMLGFVVPGETAALAGGALAGLHRANVEAVLFVVVVCAVVGDMVGYEVGKLIGPWLVDHRPLKGRREVDKARSLMERRGGLAVFLGRWVAVVRALVPGLAGMSAVRYRTFIICDILSGVLWGAAYVILGYVLGHSFDSAAAATTKVELALVVVVVLLGGGYLLWRRRHRRQVQQATPPH